MYAKRYTKVSIPPFSKGGRGGFSDEKGMVLVVGLLLIVVLMMLGTTAVLTSTTDMMISANYKTSNQAFYAAEAGIEEARARLKTNDPPDSNEIADSYPTDTGWAAYIGDATKAHDKGGYDSGNSKHSRVDSLQSTLDYTVKIVHQTNASGNILYWGDSNADGINERNATTGQNIYLVTSYGAAAGANKTIEVEMARLPPITVPGALYGNVIGGGGTVSVDGTDNCSVSSAVPALAYVTQQNLWWEEPPGGSATCLPAGQETAQIPALNIEEMVTALKASATDILTEDKNNYTIGTASDYRVVYCDATNLTNDQELDFQNLTGYGMLVVKGNVYFSGNLTWHGLIIASGNASFYGGGSEDKNIYGAVLANSTATLQGKVNIKYDSCELDKTTENMPLVILSWKEDTVS